MATLDLSAGSVALTHQLVDIESVSGNEGEIADAIEQALASSAHLEIVRDGNAVVASTRLGRDRRVVIAGHIDTVPVNNNLPGQVRTEGGEDLLYGRGSVDMKGGCAVMLTLAAELSEPVVDVTWVWYDNEEVAAHLNGLGRLMRNRPELFADAAFAVLCEPTSAEIEGGCNGTLRIEVSTTGRRAHSARPWMGENAIHKAAPILARLTEYEPQTVHVDGLDYREGLNAVAIRGGIAGNVIPDECVVTINYRFAPDKSGAQALNLMEHLFAGFDIRVDDLSEGARPGLDTPFTQTFIAAVGGVAKPKYGWTDVARFAELGIPAVNYGPGDPSLAHTDDERLPLAEVTRVETGLRTWLTGA